MRRSSGGRDGPAAEVGLVPGEEGPAWPSMGGRSAGKYDPQEGPRYAVEFARTAHDGAMIGRGRLVLKLHEVLSSPFGDAVARIVEESYRLLPTARVVGSYD